MKTPIKQLKNSTIFAKLESFNPSGSIKDRPAKYIIEQAEKSGTLTKEKTILEATSGNMGIALAMIGAQKGYKVEIVMSKVATKERKMILEALGAKLILTDAKSGTTGALKKAKELASKHPDKYFLVDQFNNAGNIEAGYYGIAQEILEQASNIDVVVASSGTSGTLMGIAKKFKEVSPNTKIIGVFPEKGYKIPGIQNPEGDFIGKIFKKDLIDETHVITDEEAENMVRKVAREEGVLIGPSSGAALTAAIKEEGRVVVIFPDGGERYLSTGLFD